MKKYSVTTLAVASLAGSTLLVAQVARDRNDIPLKHWPAPLYWQPSTTESNLQPNAQSPVGSLVFVGMTPCRVVDTRAAAGPLGGPSVAGGTSRTFPVRSSTTCTIPSTAQAYSFNVTVVPPGFLGFITLYPTGTALRLRAEDHGLFRLPV